MAELLSDITYEPEWLEMEITNMKGLRVWHVIFFGFSGFISVGKQRRKIEKTTNMNLFQEKISLKKVFFLHLS